MKPTAPPTSRRVLLAGGLGLAALRVAPAAAAGLRYRLTTELYRVRLSVEFHDQFTGSGRWLASSSVQGGFCPSLTGENKLCPATFTGSVAIVRYEVSPRVARLKISTMREHVRTIDWDHRLEPRAPFHRTVELQRGIASDVQAFGYSDERSPFSMDTPPWYYFRQDLYLEAQQSPFLIIHWKHALDAIRLLDVIPENGTSFVTG